MKIEIQDKDLDGIFIHFFKIYDACLCGSGPETIKMETIESLLDQIRRYQNEKN